MQHMTIAAKVGKQKKMVFLSASQISKSKDGKGVKSFPDLNAIVNCTKNVKTLENIDKYLKSAYCVTLLR